MKTLVLNAGYEPMLLINWQRAMCLVFSNKAEVVAEYNNSIRTVSKVFPMPSVVRLTRYVRVVRRLGLVRCTRRNIILRDKNQCQYCGVICNHINISIDHIVPRSKGGTTIWENVVTACHSCNRKKGDYSPEEVGMMLIRKPMQPSWRDLLQELNIPAEAQWLNYLQLAS